MDKIEKTLAAGGAVVLPTETVYGLFAQALNEEAVERVYELKEDLVTRLSISMWLAWKRFMPFLRTSPVI